MSSGARAAAAGSVMLRAEVRGSTQTCREFMAVILLKSTSQVPVNKNARIYKFSFHFIDNKLVQIRNKTIQMVFSINQVKK